MLFTITLYQESGSADDVTIPVTCAPCRSVRPDGGSGGYVLRRLRLRAGDGGAVRGGGAQRRHLLRVHVFPPGPGAQPGRLPHGRHQHRGHHTGLRRPGPHRRHHQGQCKSRVPTAVCLCVCGRKL